METKQINVCGKIYQSRPEQNVCEGCAFYNDDEGPSLTKCEMAIDSFDCIKNKIIWEQVGVKTGAMSKQVGGSHYQKKIQPWDIISEWGLNFWEGNALKYILRHKDKAKRQDLEKAIHYLEYLIENYDEVFPDDV